MVVEDTPVNLEIVVTLLEDEGYEVITAENGQIALNIVRNEVVDLVLMDCQMPVMDGYEATRQIRNLPGKEQLPILALTAHALTSDREKCLNAGMNDHITKPIDFDLLFRKIREWLPSETYADVK
ncbi:MAG: response regulator [Hahellaceae bacterium]|nr:response regulator [Hahellaceae bacterium]